ncbi:ribose-phosphate diphosphokinase [Calycomorphotria hydatis]|uniref:ribose-phosphate diphosphokinase n=1 Tax=Calycomorphotria hydatis TaxID=2528027 RepID=A0A517T6I8_9PLAN|nr:ribose-phosphate pyrophosphokinase [Calycomorphotria hydatis]QDT63993.1 Ribose-phosphate pyrophosphokinase [Calycomorphotria hydatis]
MNNFRLFGLDGSKKFAQRVAKYLDVPVSRHFEEFFSDRETYARSEVNVRGCDVYVISSLFADKDQSVPEKLTKLLFFIGSLVDASARRITVVTPYLAFARQDRKTESRAPISIKYLAQCMEAVGTNRVLTMDVHNLSAFQNAFRIPTDNLEAKNLLADYLCGVDSGRDGDGIPQPVDTHITDPLIKNPNDLVVLAPDSGGMGRAKRFRNALESRLQLHNKIDVAYLDKERMDGNSVKGSKVIGEIKGKRVIILDDMISSGGTVSICVDAVNKHKGEVWAVCATHGLFVGNGVEKNLEEVPRLVITDTIRPFRLKSSKWEERLFVIPTSMMFAQAIRRTHEEGGSISDLLQ